MLVLSETVIYNDMGIGYKLTKWWNLDTGSWGIIATSLEEIDHA